MRGSRLLHVARTSWVDIAWVAFILLNLLAMRLIPSWQTVPFLIIWVTLTVIYGFRLWRLGSALVTTAIVTLATGGLIGWQVLLGKQDADYLAEVPLLAMLFVVVVWHSRRRVAALEEMRKVSEHNMRLLDQQRRFLQDASHELGTPITIALGHAELIEQTADDQAIAKDAGVAVAELHRMRRLTSRLLLLAATDGPGSIQLEPVDMEEVVIDAARRWSHVDRRWSLGPMQEAWALGDKDRLIQALDALVENAVAHTEPQGRIELSLRRDGASRDGASRDGASRDGAGGDGETVVIAVSDSGPGIPPAEVERIFGRFSRTDAGRSREAGGFGLGLAIVKAIAEAHHGSVAVKSTVGAGSVFEMRLPAAVAPTRQPAEQTAVS